MDHQIDREAFIRGCVARGMTCQEIGAQLGLSRSRIGQLMKRFGVRPSHGTDPIRLATVARVAAEGGSFSDAARELNLSRCAIAGIAHRAGIKFGARA